MIRLILACISGIIVSLCLPISLNTDPILSVLLPFLLLSVGISLGSVRTAELFRIDRKFVYFPIASLVGSVTASMIYARFVHAGAKEIVLAGGAMGFYSLPAVMVSAKLGSSAGILLLSANMLREFLTIMLSPLIVKVFGKPSIVAMGGATTMDVSLAAIKETAGKEYVPLAILNGLILTIGVPFVTSAILAWVHI